jgi:hypothetical protein
MYEPNTILTLKEQRDPDEETNEPFAYNEVRVVGESPVSHADKGDWTGTDARGVIIVPLTNFGGTLDEPFGKLREIYDVTSVPEVEVDVVQKIRVVNATSAQAGPTPEEVFAAQAPGVAPEEGQVRGRTLPLGEPGGPADADGPLGQAPSGRADRKRNK